MAKKLKLISGGITYYVTDVPMTVFNGNLNPETGDINYIESGNLKGLTTDSALAASFTDEEVADAKKLYPGFTDEPYVAPTPRGNFANYVLAFILTNGGAAVTRDIDAILSLLGGATIEVTLTNLSVTGGIGSAVDIGVSYAGSPPATSVTIATGVDSLTDTFQVVASGVGPPLTFTAELNFAKAGGIPPFKTIAIEGVGA